MPTWPASLPQAPEREGYSEQWIDPVLRAPMRGPQLTRLQFTAVPKLYVCPFMFTLAQLDTFEAFFEQDLFWGALPYDWKERGIPTNPVASFQIVEMPVYIPVGGEWRAIIKTMRLP